MSNADESLSTLRFASSAKRIKNKASINEDERDALLRKFQTQIAELRRQLQEAEDAKDAAAAAEDGPEGQDQTDGAQNGTAEEPPNELLDKLNALQSKIMVGGENLLEKAELQEQLLAETEVQLQEQR